MKPSLEAPERKILLPVFPAGKTHRRELSLGGARLSRRLFRRFAPPFEHYQAWVSYLPFLFKGLEKISGVTFLFYRSKN
jgi:hypothetical protein